MIVKAHTASGLEESTELDLAGINHIHVEFTPTGDGTDINLITLMTSDPAFVPEEIVFEDECVPDNPFYIRWINRHGGYDYEMMENRYFTESETSSIENIYPYIRNSEPYNRTTETISLEYDQVVTVGKTGLDKPGFYKMQAILTSPKIDVYNPALEMWIGIVLAGNHSLTYQSDLSIYDVEFDFELAKDYIQF